MTSLTEKILVIVIESSPLKEVSVEAALESYFQIDDIETKNYLKSLKYNFCIPVDKKKISLSENLIISQMSSLENLSCKSCLIKHVVCIGKFISNLVLKLNLKNIIIYPFERNDNKVTLETLKTYLRNLG